MASETQTQRETRELPLAIRPHKRVLSLFLFAVLLPAVALGFFGLRALSSDRIRIEELLRREQQEMLRVAESRIRTGLDELFAGLRKGSSDTLGIVVRILQGGDCHFVRERFVVRARERDPRMHETGGAIFEAEKLEHARGALGEAARRYESLAETDDAWLRSQALLGLGRVRRRLGQTDGAVEAYSRLLERVPDVLDRESAASLFIAALSIAKLEEERGEGADALPVLLETYALLAEERWILSSALVQFYATALEAKLDDACHRRAGTCSPYATLRNSRDVRLQAVDALGEVHETLSAGMASWGQSRLPPSEMLLELPGSGTLIAAVRTPDDGLALVAASVIDEKELAARLLGNLRVNRNQPIEIRVTSQNGETLAASSVQPTAGEALTLSAEGLPRWRLEAFHDPDHPPYTSRRQLYLGLTGVLGLWLVFGVLLTARSLRQEMALVSMKTQFVSMVSHEFKSPISSLRALLDGLRGGSVKEPGRIDQYLGVATSELQRLTRLVNNLLDFSRIEAGTRRYRLVPTDLAALLHDLLVHFEARAKELGFHIDSRIENVPKVEADADAISQAVLNLLDNAVKFSNGSRWIGLRLFRDGRDIVIEVEDRGCGLETDAIENLIGERRASDVERQGLGLGLPIVKHIVEAHGGRIAVQPTPGADRASGWCYRSTRDRSVRILVVDDEPGILLALGDQLRAEGYEVETAMDGLEAYEKIGTVEPDLVVLDVMLPRLNGFHLCKRLRREGNDVPILFLTAKNDETDIVLGLGFGADDYVTKPFSMREVVARVEALLRRVSFEPGAGTERHSEAMLAFGDIQLNLGRYEARRAGEPIELTPREYHAIRFLSERAGEVVTRDEILDRVWGEEVFVSHRSVDNLVYGIRQKIEKDPHDPDYILSIRSVGYKFVPEGAEGG